MSYQQGYPQQPPSGVYQQGGYAPEMGGGGGNPATAIIAAVLGLVAAASLVVLDIHFFNDEIPDRISFGDLPGEFKTLVILRFAGAAVLLIGLILVLFRKVAGALVLVFGALVALAAILLYPVLLKDYVPGLDFGEYIKEVFKFDATPATFSAITVIASPLALILAVLPPTLNYLRGSQGGEQYPQQTYPQQGYPQQPNW
jgi:amino acid permease